MVGGWSWVAPRGGLDPHVMTGPRSPVRFRGTDRLYHNAAAGGQS